MHSFLRTRTVLVAALCSLGLAVLAPTASAATAPAKPKPGVPAKKRGFRLFARTLGAMTINRVVCGLNSDGEVCVDSTNSSVIGGGFWPKGTPDQYVFNSGLQVAGIIGDDANPEWVGDTTGAFFFDPKGTTQHGAISTTRFCAAGPRPRRATCGGFRGTATRRWRRGGRTPSA